METRTLGGAGLCASPLGLGCMGMTAIYGDPDPKEAAATVSAAIDAGINLVDTADAYASGRNEQLVGEAIARRREAVVLATKFGNIRLPDGTRTVNGRPEYVAEACDKSLTRLGTDYIDLYYLHRVDPTVPIEDTVGAMAGLVDAGKVRYLGLSEAGPDTLRAAHAVHPISVLQTEYSLATRDVEAAILPVCRELGIGFVAYAPLSRGLLSGNIVSFDGLAGNDRRRDMPRFQGDNLATNLTMVSSLARLAAEKHISPAGLSLAWVLAQGRDIVPIPGCSRRHTLHDCLGALELQLSTADLAVIETAVDAQRIEGTRYPAKQMQRLGI